MTIAQCLDKIFQLMNHYSLSGNKIPKSDAVLTDYRYRALSLVDTAQKELCVHFPIRKTCTMTQRRLRNLLPDANIADVGQRKVFDLSNAAALTFLTDAALTVTVYRWQNAVEETEDTPAAEAGWVEEAALTTAKNTCFREYVLRFAPYERQQLVFTPLGSTNYAYIGNAAAYAEVFDTDDAVPAFRSFRSHPLPEDFYRFEDISFQPAPASHVIKDIPYALGYRTIEIDRRFDGAFLLVYRAMCPTVDTTTPEDTVLPVGDICAELIPYYAAAILAAEENPQLSQQLMSIYHTKVLNLDTAAALGHVENDFYKGGVSGAV